MRSLVFLAALVIAGPACAAQAVPGPLLRNGHKLSGPSLALALEAAQAAIDACKAKGYPVGVSVVDESGGLRVSLGADGALAADTNGSRRSAAFSAVEKEPGTELLQQVKTDKALEAKFKSNYANWQIREGALLIKSDGKVIGAIAVEGHPHDSKKAIACAQAGIDRIQSRLN